jgi:hypothetical protein
VRRLEKEEEVMLYIVSALYILLVVFKLVKHQRYEAEQLSLYYLMCVVVFFVEVPLKNWFRTTKLFRRISERTTNFINQFFE